MYSRMWIQERVRRAVAICGPRPRCVVARFYKMQSSTAGAAATREGMAPKGNGKVLLRRLQLTPKWLMQNRTALAVPLYVPTHSRPTEQGRVVQRGGSWGRKVS